MKRRSVGWFGALGCMCLALAAGCGEEPRRVSPGEQRRLPTRAYGLIQDLCFRGDSRYDRQYGIREANPGARRQFSVLVRSLRMHADAIVRVEFAPADSPGVEIRDLTVRELAETHVEGAEEGGLPNEAGCYRRGQARLKRSDASLALAAFAAMPSSFAAAAGALTGLFEAHGRPDLAEVLDLALARQG